MPSAYAARLHPTSSEAVLLIQEDERYNDTMKRALRRLSLICLVALVLFLGLSWTFALHLTRARPSAVGAPPSDLAYPVEAIKFTTADDHALAGWLVAAPDSRRAVVLLHGYGGNRSQMLPRARFFRELGYAALLYDARGCGESSGACITFGYRERADIVAAVKVLKERGYTDIACLGMSQGGATILFAAEEMPDVKCVIVESVYDALTHAVDRRMRRFTGLPGWLAACAMVPFAEQRLELAIGAVRPVDHIARLACPVLVISGDKDDKTWPEDTARLFAAARDPKELWMLPAARHEDLFRFPGYEAKVRAFLTRHMEAGAAP